MQKIYLAKPGGEREGPYTLEQINHDLATKKYKDEDFWAWHEGLPSWMPLYSMPGVSAKAATVAVPETAPQPVPPKTESQPEAPKPSAARPPFQEPEGEPPKAEAATAPSAEPEPKTPEISATPSFSSGKPFSALEQIFVLTTGEGPSAFPSDVTTAMLVATVGETLDTIRSKVPVDVIGRADAAVLKTIRAGSIPNSAWRALFAIKPAIAQSARDGAYHLCVRTSPVESNEAVALFLLYRKQTP
jgi:hypothetical protein